LPSLVAAWPNADLQIAICHSITGPLHVPEGISELIVQDSIIQSPLRSGPARRTPALVSGSLASFPALSSSTPAVNLQIGDEGPYAVTFAEMPSTLAQARDQLQAAIRAAQRSPAFADAQVISATNRLIILPGVPAPVSMTAVDADPTSIELRLSDGSERLVEALVTPALEPFPALSAADPALNVTLGTDDSYRISLTPVPTSLAQARDQLHSTIRAAHSDPAFQNAIVGNLEEQLVVLPGVAGTAVLFDTTANDRTTLRELGLVAGRPALAGDGLGVQPGPKTTLERVTMLGSTHIRELALASETIFSEPVVAQRRQRGCTRFCYVPAGSRVPRRYRCQPDVALVQFAENRNTTVDALTGAERSAVETRLTPTFTSIRYGEPGYAQLSRSCADEIRTGAEDGAEMGGFKRLQQPQREANLRTALEEYLRFGLEAGIFFVT
jgi:hypothetical protein